MKSKLTTDEFFRLFGDLLSLQSAPSVMRRRLELPAEASAEDIEQAARDLFDDYVLDIPGAIQQIMHSWRESFAGRDVERKDMEKLVDRLQDIADGGEI